MKKRIISLILCSGFLFSVVFPVSAREAPADNNMEIERLQLIDTILEEMAQTRSLLLMEDNSFESERIERIINSLEDYLLQQDVTIVPLSELVEKGLVQRINGPQKIGYPGSTTTTKWYSTTTSRSASGHTYSIQRIYAQGLKAPSKLAVDNQIAYNSSTINNAATTKIIVKVVSAIADFVIGSYTNNLISWTWSQLNSLLNDYLADRAVNNCTLHYSIITTVCFFYVSYTPTSQQYFCLAANSIQRNVDVRMTGISGGIPFDEHTTKKIGSITKSM